jgi:sugar phosphate isomerase/epimerase
MVDDFSVRDGIPRVLARKQSTEDVGLEYFLETHRHSITEDPKKARMIADEMPDLMFTGDLSHWIVQGYTREEMSWIFRRIGHMHIRIASENNVQVEVSNGKAREVNNYFDEFVDPVVTGGYSGIMVLEIIPQLLSNQRYYPVEDTFNLLREVRARYSS